METYRFRNLASVESIQHSVDLAKYNGFNGPITFSFPSSTTYDPFGMLVVGAALRQFKQRNPQSQTYISLNKNDSACSYAGHMGFFKSISEKINYGKLPGEAMGSSTYLPITPIDLETIRQRSWRGKVPVQQQIQTTAYNLSKSLAHNNEPFRETLAYIFREIIRNSEEHSRANTVWVCAQYWPSYDLVEIGLLDEGIGIYKSLKSNRHFSKAIKGDLDALRLSIMPGISEAYKRQDEYEPWANSGYGLYIAKGICEKLGSPGLFIITSGKSCITSKTRVCCNTEQEVLSADFQGTAICMRFSTHSLENFETTRSEIISEGQNEASRIEKAIKKASYSSGGLIDLFQNN